MGFYGVWVWDHVDPAGIAPLCSRSFRDFLFGNGSGDFDCQGLGLCRVLSILGAVDASRAPSKTGQLRLFSHGIIPLIPQFFPMASHMVLSGVFFIWSGTGRKPPGMELIR